MQQGISTIHTFGNQIKVKGFDTASNQAYMQLPNEKTISFSSGATEVAGGTWLSSFRQTSPKFDAIMLGVG